VNTTEPGWRTPKEVRFAAWIASIGGAASPMLGGFSLASVIVVCQDTTAFRWPAAAIVALTVAATALILALQCAQIANGWYVSRQDLPIVHSYDEKNSIPKRSDDAYKDWDTTHRHAEQWAHLARWAYHGGIYALLAGLALALAPPPGTGAEESLRWLAFAITIAMLTGQVIWRISHRTPSGYL
jgi:hypothetical protein